MIGRSMPNRPVRLDLVVPVYRGERYLARLVAEIDALRVSLARRGLPLELVRACFVDDAAVDGSAALLDHLARTHDWIEVLHLRENAGQHGATVAGFAKSDADWIATLDEDLQHRPHHILELLARAVASSADLVYAAPSHAVHRTFYRDLASWAAKSTISWVTGIPEIRQINSFRLVRGDVARAASRLFRPSRYLDVVLLWCSRRVESVAIELIDGRDAAGEPSGYSFSALLNHAARMIRTAREGPPQLAAEEEAALRTRNEFDGSSREPRGTTLSNRLAIDRSQDRRLVGHLVAPP